MSELTIVEASTLQEAEAILNITWNGQNGNLADPVPYDASVEDLKSWAVESIRNGDVAGIDADPSVDFADFIVDRFNATADKPYRTLFLRPKTPFGQS